MTQARWQDRACATSVWASVWCGPAFGRPIVWLGLLGSGCEVVGEIGTDDLAASTSTGNVVGTESGTTEDATKPTMTSETTSSPESSSDDGESDSAAFDLGGAATDTSGESSSSDDDSSTAQLDDLESSSSTVGGGGAPCCEVAMEPGCEDPELEACVCAADDFCCLNEWDAACVDIAMFGNCGAGCDEMPLAPKPGECCVANDDGPGCTDVEVQDCVCATDPYCCAYTWDGVCVDYVEQLDCGVCE